MIDVLIATHGDLAQAYASALTAIAGVQDHVFVALLQNTETTDVFAEKLQAHCDKPDRKKLLILCDLRYGTPHNAAARVAATQPGVRVLSGVNLAMVLEAALSQTANGEDFDAWVEAVRAAGLQDIGV